DGCCALDVLRFLRLERNDDALAIALDPRRIPRSERDDVALANARHLGRLPLHVLRVVIAAVDDDDLLGAPADEEVLLVEEAEIARAEIVPGERVARALRVFPVALHDARPGDANLADAALGERGGAGGVFRIEDLHRVL